MSPYTLLFGQPMVQYYTAPTSAVIYRQLLYQVSSTGSLSRLTAWSTALLEKLTGSQIVKKFPAFYGNRKFITAFVRAHHLSLSWVVSILSMPSHTIFWRSSLYHPSTPGYSNWTLSFSVDKKNQLDVTFCIFYFSSNSCSTCFVQPCAHHQELTTAWCYSLVLVCAVAAGRWSRPVGR